MDSTINALFSILGNFLPELVGAGVGVYLGYRWGLKQDRQIQKEEEKERKDDTIKSLIDEISENKKYLDEGLIERRYKEKIKIYAFESELFTDSFDSCIFSGAYQLLSTDTQRRVSSYYGGCKNLNHYMDRLIYGEISDNEAFYLQERLQKVHPGLQVITEDVLERLRNELTYTKTFNQKASANSHSRL